ncbi:MAG: hypothetical protein M1832_003697 [Thelocarpon impressellum]|nr:MAG: hypothetical protein M1832_003697 [Thelocarpon impressellum]
MPSVQYFNQSAPFWDFVASFEDQAFGDRKAEEKGGEKGEEKVDESGGEKSAPTDEQTRTQRGRGHCRGGPCGPGRRGRAFRGPCGPPPFAMHPFAQFFASQMNREGDDSEPKDFQPPVDIFSTESSYHIHVSIPGAKKEDVGLNWDADKSELSIAGVVYRPGDEDFLKTLAMGERKVGVFDRKVRLGNERHPAEVDSDGITAKLEDGVLRVEVPKVEKEYVDVKKVDIE